MFSPVIPRDRSLSKNIAVSPTSSGVVALRSGASSSIFFKIVLKSPIPFVIKYELDQQKSSSHEYDPYLKN